MNHLRDFIDEYWTSHPRELQVTTVLDMLEQSSEKQKVARQIFDSMDADGDGQQDTGESGLSDWVVYIDANGNSQLDSGEASTSSGANGDYAFADLAEGAEFLTWKRGR